MKDSEGKLMLSNLDYIALQTALENELLPSGQLNFDYASDRDLHVLESGCTASFEEYYHLNPEQSMCYKTEKRIFRTSQGRAYLLSVSGAVSPDAIYKEEFTNSTGTPGENGDPAPVAGYDGEAVRLPEALTILLVGEKVANLLLPTPPAPGAIGRMEVASSCAEALSAANRMGHAMIVADSSRLLGKQQQIAAMARAAPILLIAYLGIAGHSATGSYTATGFMECLQYFYQEMKQKKKPLPPHPGTTDAPLPEMTEDALFDFAMLGTMAEDAEFVRKMQQYFIETVPKQLQELEEAVVQENRALAALLAHRLKATFGSISMNSSVAAMKKIEEAVLNGNDLVLLKPSVRVAIDCTEQVASLFHQKLTR